MNCGVPVKFWWHEAGEIAFGNCTLCLETFGDPDDVHKAQVFVLWAF